MNDIIGQIYLRRLEEHTPSAEYSALCRRLDELWTAAGQVLGEEQISQLQNSENDVYFRSNYEWFREGWRMGMLLSLELLGRPQ